MGCVRLNRSFWPSGMITSLTSGLPSREICLNEPCPWPFTEIDCRSVDAQTPTTALAAVSLETDLPSRVTSDSGTWSTIDWTA